MTVVIFADEAAKKELMNVPFSGENDIIWMEDYLQAPASADAVIDMLFECTDKDSPAFKIDTPLLIVNSVDRVCSTLPKPAVRINGWRGFLDRPVIEAATAHEQLRQAAEKLFRSLGRDTQWVPDQPGFVTARVISCILNEAFFSLQEKIATAADIDAAMKTGTNYPYGPFEWATLIGPAKVYHLLSVLAEHDSRYTPCLLLRQKALA